MSEAFNTYLTFSLGIENFAINVEHVEKILENQTVTEVPKSPEYMLGVFNLRGEVIPLVDTRIKFGMTKTEVTSATCVLVITIDNDGDKLKLGAMVDNVNEVINYSDSDIISLPTVGKKNKAEFLKGVLKVNDKFILLVDADKIFSVDEIIELSVENFDLEGK